MDFSGTPRSRAGTLCAMSGSLFTKVLAESLGAVRPAPSSQDGFGSAAGAAAKQLRYDQAAKGIASTGRPISTIHGAVRDSAVHAIRGGGTKANGGGGVAGGLAAQALTGQRAHFAADLTYPFLVVGTQIALKTAWGCARALGENWKAERPS